MEGFVERGGPRRRGVEPLRIIIVPQRVRQVIAPEVEPESLLSRRTACASIQIGNAAS